MSNWLHNVWHTGWKQLISYINMVYVEYFYLILNFKANPEQNLYLRNLRKNSDTYLVNFFTFKTIIYLVRLKTKNWLIKKFN